MLTIGDKENDSTKFIEFMLKVILETVSQFESIEMSDKACDVLSDKVLDKMSDKEKFSSMKYIPIWRAMAIFGMLKAAELSGKSSSTVRRYLVKLVDLDILKTEGENRNRRYMLSDKIIDE